MSSSAGGAGVGAESTPLHSSPLSDANNEQNRKTFCTRALLSVLIGGQLLAVLISSTGVFSQLLSKRGVNIPTSQSFVNYLALSLCIIPTIRKWRRRKQQGQHVHIQGEQYEERVEVTHESSTSTPHFHANAPLVASASNSRITSDGGVITVRTSFLSVPLWQYFLLGACDVEGNFLLVKAYQYTTLTSIQLLDCFTIPVVMILSALFLKVSYNRKHLLGAFICVVGLTLLIASDMMDSDGDDTSYSSSDKVLGDTLVLIGCVFYAISNIGQEYLVKAFDRFEFLGMLGICGSIISVIQMAILERQNLAQVDFGDPVILAYLFGFNACLFLLYFFTPILLIHSSALFMNLSFLMSDFWSILFAVFLFHAKLHPLYFVAFSIIILGLLLYNLAGVEGGITQLGRDLFRNELEEDEQLNPSEEVHEVHESHRAHSSLVPNTHAHTRAVAGSSDNEYVHQPIRTATDDGHSVSGHIHFNSESR